MDKAELQIGGSTAFYVEAVRLLAESGVPFMVGGAFAVYNYTGIFRDTKDLDIFVYPADYPKVLRLFAAKGYKIELYDVRWIAKIFKDDFFIDVIFNSVTNVCRVDESWFDHAPEGDFYGIKVKMVAAEELIWCKSYVWNRERFDGADINHLILRYGKKLDWQWILRRLDQHWHLLLAEIIMFQFVYPSDYAEIIPKWLFDELMGRASDQYTLPMTAEHVCRGPMIDNTQYSKDVTELAYKSFTIKTI